jgi:hypothetical protein
VQHGKKHGGQPLKVDGGRSQQRLDVHILEAPTHGSSETLPGLGLPVEAFGSPAMATVEVLLLLCPTNAASTSSQQRWVIVADHHGLIAASFGQQSDAKEPRE